MGDGGKGSKPRPYSVSQDQFADNWDKIFGSKKMAKYALKLVNTLNNEEWACDDFDTVQTVDGVEYVTVYKPETPNRKHLMRKDALRKVVAK